MENLPNLKVTITKIRSPLMGREDSVNRANTWWASGPAVRGAVKRFWNQICISLGARERRPVTGRGGTSESVCHQPGSRVRRQLQPGHCWLTEAGKQANTKALTWWDKSVNIKREKWKPGQVGSPVLEQHTHTRIQTKQIHLLRSSFTVAVNQHPHESREYSKGRLSLRSADVHTLRRTRLFTQLMCPYGVFVCTGRQTMSKISGQLLLCALAAGRVTQMREGELFTWESVHNRCFVSQITHSPPSTSQQYKSICFCFFFLWVVCPLPDVTAIV